MDQNNYAVGLDIGTTKIVAIVGKFNEYNKLEILGYGKAKSTGVHRGIVQNIAKTIHSIQLAVEEAEINSGVKITDAVVGIAGQHIRSLQHSDYIIRNNKEQVIDDADINRLESQVFKLTMQPGEEIIHVLPQEFRVDGQDQISEPQGMYGERLEANFHIVVGQMTSIKNIGRCVQSAGLNLTGINLEPLASADAVLSDDEKEAGVALIDIGGGTTDLAIFKDGIIRHTAVIPFGGNVITEDIKIGCSIIEKQAEQLKVKFGSAWPYENKDNEIVAIPGLRGKEPKEITLLNLSKIINARVTEIIELVAAQINAYGHHNDPSKKLIAGIVLTGGGSQLKHLKQLVEYLTGMDTRIGYPTEHLTGKSSEELKSPLFATSVGLVMESLNIIVKKEKEEEERKRIEQEIERKKAIEKYAELERKDRVIEVDEPQIQEPIKIKRATIFENFFRSFKEFLEKAE